MRAAQPHEHQRGIFTLRKALSCLDGVHGKEGNSDTSRTDPIRMSKNGMVVSSREPWRDEADVVQKRWARALLCAMVVEALPDGAHRGVRGEGGLFGDRGSFGFQSKNSFFRNDDQGS